MAKNDGITLLLLEAIARADGYLDDDGFFVGPEDELQECSQPID